MMIRTTWNNRFDRITSVLNTLGGEMSRLQNQAATGLSFTRPSDDPGRVQRVHNLSEKIADQQTWKENSTRATSWQSTAENALQTASDLLTRTYELATQMSSETYTASDRAEAALEVDQIYQEMLAVANTEMGGRYVFAGAATTTRPFDALGTYLGAATEATTLVGQDLEVTVGFVGSQVFQDGVDVMALLQDFSTALNTDDDLGIQAALGDVVTAIDTVARARTVIGAEMNTALDATELANNLHTLYSTDLDSETGIDEVETYTRLSDAQSSYEAALKVVAAMKGNNLFSVT